MDFIQLSTKTLPSSASDDTLFTCLARVASGGPYRLALLTRRSGNVDRPLHVLLKSIGFEVGAAFTGTGLGLPTDWQFMILRDSAESPLSSMTQTILNSFLSLGALTPNGNLLTPATLAVNTSDFSSTWRSGAEWPERDLFDFVDFDQSTSTFAWSEGGATGDGVCKPNFTLRHHEVATSIGGVDVTFPSLEYAIDLTPQADTSAIWNGALLNLGTTNLGTLAFDAPVAISSTLQLIVTGDGRAQLRKNLDADQTLTIIGPDTVQLILPADSFRFALTARVGGQRATRVLLASNNPLNCHVKLKTHLLMASTAPLPVIVPTALAQGSSFAPAVQFELHTLLDSAWNRDLHPVLELEGQDLVRRTWAFADIYLNGQTSVVNKPEITVQFPESISAALPGLRFSLDSLLGQGASDDESRVEFSLTPGLGRGAFRSAIQNNGLFLPMLLRLAIRPPGATVTEVIEVILGTRIVLKGDLSKVFRVEANRWFFRLLGPPLGDALTIFDLHIFALIIPTPPLSWDADNPAPEQAIGVFSEQRSHGWLDIENREFVLRPPNDEAELPSKPMVIFPGDIREADNSISDLSNRLVLLFETLDPNTWPDEGPDKLFLRVNGSGLTLHAKVLPNVNAILAPKSSDTFSEVPLKPHAERRGVSSELVIIDNRIRAALLFGEVRVPACKDLIAAVEVGLRQDRLGEVPKVIAKVSLERDNKSPVVELHAGFLDFRCDDLEFILEWQLGTRKWNLSVLASGSMSFGGALADAGGLDELRRDNAIVVRNLNLLEMHKGNFNIGAGLTLDKPVEFNVLDGLFGVTLRDLRISWTAKVTGTGSFEPDVLSLSCSTAEFRYRDPGVLEVQVEVGSLGVDFNVAAGFKAKMRLPNRLGLAVRIGPAARFRGEIAWVDEPTERYFAAAGSLQLEGMPEVNGLLKIGTGVKSNGRTVPNIVVFAGMDVDVALFPAVVVKNLAGGIGINNRLTGIGTSPDAEEILRNIDQVHPERLDGWTFVRDGDFYLSIVASAILASNTGGADTFNAYVASIVFSLDTDLRAVAAGRLWLSSSVNFTREPANRDRPALVGAMVFSPRNRTISVALQSRRNPAIQNNPLFEKILNKGSIRMAFLISPSLVDYNLQEVSYSDEFLGFPATIRGSFRIAVFDGAVLIRQSVGITSSFEKELSAGPGGFSAHGDLNVAAEYAGIISGRGVMAYAFLEASLRLRVTAFIEIEFSIGSGRFKKSWSKTFRLPERSIELGLSGQAAFNERGEFGFAGSLSISVSICGYRLSISPSFAIRNEVVEDVRARVGEFEQRIEAFRRQLLGGGNKRSLFAAAAPVSESWLHYRSNEFSDATSGDRVRRHLFLPAASNEWFTPFRTLAADETEVTSFPRGVTKIEVTLVGGEQRVLLMPWDKQNAPSEVHEERDLITDMLVASGVDGPTSAAQSRLEQRRATTYRPIRDPRVLSDSREFWKQSDRRALPDFALPIDMLSVEEVLNADNAGPPSSEALREVLAYEFYRRRKDRLQKHGGALDDVEKLQQTRGSIIHLLIQDLQRPNPPETFPFWRVDASQTLGLLIDLPIAASIASIQITRYGDDGVTPVQVPAFLQTVQAGEVESRTQLLRPRQKFLASDSITPIDVFDRADGTVTVKVPVFFNDELLTDFLSQLGHFQIYRQIGEEGDTVLIADYAYPDLTYLDDERDDGQQDSVVVVAPYLLTDTFAAAELGKLGIVPGETKVRYALRHIAPGQEGREDGQLLFGPALQLHVPKINRFPDELSMIAPVNALYVGDPAAGEFVLATFRGEELQFASFEPRTSEELADPLKANSLTVDDFELWVERTIDPGAGFFFGGERTEIDAAAPQTPSNPQQLGETRSLQGQGDKLQIRVAATANGFKFADPSLLDPRFGHQFFVRDARTPNSDAFIPVPLQLVRQLPAVTKVGSHASWNEPVRPVPVARWEWIDPTDVQDVLTGRGRFMSANDFIAQVRARGDDSPSQQIGYHWENSGAQGGLEILTVDRDDPLFRNRQLCEIQLEENFPRSRRDFRDASLWTLTPEENRRRPEVSLPVFTAGTAAHIDFSLFVIPPDDNPLVQELKRQRDALLPGEHRSDSWRFFFDAAKNWVSAHQKFLQSPLALNDKPLRFTRRYLELLLRASMVGLKASPVDINDIAKLDAASAALEAAEQGLISHLELVEKTRTSDFTADETGRVLLLDFKNARQLAAIMRRRLTCAAEVFTSDDDDLPLLPNDPARDSTDVENWLPGKGAFDLIRDNPDAQGPLCSQFLNGTILDPTSSGGEHREKSAANQLKDTVDALLNLIRATTDERKHDIAAIVGKAAGLTRMMQALELQVGSVNGRVERRPHHSISVGADDDGKRVPVETSLAVLLSDSMRVENFVRERNQLTANAAHDNSSDPVVPAARHAGEVASLLNLFERLGFAVDFVLRNSLDALEPQSHLIQLVETIPVPAAHIRLLFVAREPDSEYPQEDESYVGYAHAKLVVVPQVFWDLLKSPTLEKQKIDVWLKLRAINGDSVPDRGWQGLGAVVNWLSQADVNTHWLIRGEARDRRWQTVPCLAGRGHVSWFVPSTFGHRFRVSIRKVSRYEPLIRWAERLERLVEHDGAPTAEVDVRRVIGGTVRAGEDRPEQLPAFVYSHPQLIRFSYLLPSAGARSLYNRISSIRTGFRGCEIQVEYRIRDHQDQDLKLAKVLAELEPVTGTHTAPGDLDMPPRKVEPIPTTDTREFFDPRPVTVQNLNTRVRLFRHERMLQYDHLPFFYQFRLRVATLYDAELMTPTGALPATPGKAAERLPAYVGFTPFAKDRWSIVAGSGTRTIKGRMFLSKNREHLAPVELEAAPPPRVQEHDHVRGYLDPWDPDRGQIEGIRADELPDLGLGFHFFHEKPRAGATDKKDKLYYLAFEVLLPWHVDFKKSDAGGTSIHPLARGLHSDVDITIPRPKIRYGVSSLGDGFGYCLDLEFKVPDSSELFHDLDHLQMLISRDGIFSQP